MTMCKECGEVVASNEITDGFCVACLEAGKVAVLADTRETDHEESREKSAIESLKMNPFSFIQMSGSLNYLVYGLVLPTLMIGLALLIGNTQIGVVLVVLAAVMSLASIVRRGMDAGITPLTTIMSLILSSWLISFVLEKTMISVKIMLMTGNLIVGMVLLAIVQNIYLVYLLVAPQKEMRQSAGSKWGQRVVLGLAVVLLLGLLAAVALPKLQ